MCMFSITYSWTLRCRLFLIHLLLWLSTLMMVLMMFMLMLRWIYYLLFLFIILFHCWSNCIPFLNVLLIYHWCGVVNYCRIIRCYVGIIVLYWLWFFLLWLLRLKWSLYLLLLIIYWRNLRFTFWRFNLIFILIWRI